MAATHGSSSATDEPTLGQLHLAFDHVRQLGKMASPSVVLGLAARCEAQGHALAVDPAGYRRAVDRAAELLALPDPGNTEGLVLGSSSVAEVADEIALAEGWPLVDHSARDVLSRPPGSTRPRCAWICCGSGKPWPEPRVRELLPELTRVLHA